MNVMKRDKLKELLPGSFFYVKNKTSSICLTIKKYSRKKRKTIEKIRKCVKMYLWEGGEKMKNNANIEKSYNIKEVAEILGLHVSTVRKMCSNGTIKAFKIGKLWKVSEGEVLKITHNGTNENAE